MTPRAWLPASLVLLVVAACFPDFQFDSEKSSAGGHGGSPATTSTAGGAGNGGGFGGSGGACNIYAIGECGMGEKCSIVDEALGVPAGVGCMEAGPRPMWSKCLANAECADGLYCDVITEICRPVCQNGNACPAGAQCIPASDQAGVNQVPGLGMCTAHCHPQTAVPCSNANGSTTCFYDTEIAEFDCIWTANSVAYTDCDSPTDCGRGLVCATTFQTYCAPWCEPVGATSGCSPFSCVSTQPAVDYDGTIYGFCG
jgi:hypothetical protein